MPVQVCMHECIPVVCYHAHDETNPTDSSTCVLARATCTGNLYTGVCTGIHMMYVQAAPEAAANV